MDITPQGFRLTALTPDDDEVVVIGWTLARRESDPTDAPNRIAPVVVSLSGVARPRVEVEHELAYNLPPTPSPSA